MVPKVGSISLNLYSKNKARPETLKEMAVRSLLPSKKAVSIAAGTILISAACFAALLVKRIIDNTNPSKK